MKKLVIFDFDGVLADSEKVWIKNLQETLNSKFNLSWDFQTTNKYIGGISNKEKRQVLDKMGYETDDYFWQEHLRSSMEIITKNGLEITPYVEKLIQKLPKKCVATGGIKAETIYKLDLIGFWNKYFNEQNIFTIDMVKHGKPEPDLFLLAAQKMGELPQDCIVIEDSIAGLTAAQKAGMETIAFLGCEMYQNDIYIKRVKELGIQNICYTMKEVEKILLDF